MKYVTQMGCLYKMTDANYRKLLKGFLCDREEDINKLGTFLTYRVENVTDFTEEQAIEALDTLEIEKVPRRR